MDVTVYSYQFDGRLVYCDDLGGESFELDEAGLQAKLVELENSDFPWRVDVWTDEGALRYEVPETGPARRVNHPLYKVNPHDVIGDAIERALRSKR